MKILFLILLTFPVFSQEEVKEDNCAQELAQKCPEQSEIYNCIIADLTNEKKKFTKECFPQFRKDLEMGKYSNPCIDEVKVACPNDNTACIRSKRASLSPDCQEFISDQGIPQAPQQEEMDKVVEDCKTETDSTCDHFMIKSDLARNEGKTKEAEIQEKEHIECMKNVFRKPDDEKCKEAVKAYTESIKKEGPAKGQQFQEIK